MRIKKLLKNSSDFYKLKQEMWEDNTPSPQPLRYPCVAIAQSEFIPNCNGTRFEVDFVYKEDFDVVE